MATATIRPTVRFLNAPPTRKRVGGVTLSGIEKSMELPMGIASTFATLVYLAAANFSDVVIAVAVPVNTALLVLLALISRHNGRKLDRNQQTTVHAANAAASAAETAADAARITKEIGGMMRTVDPRPSSAADTPRSTS